MSTEAMAPAHDLTARVAGEIRAHLGRYSISRSELARRLDVDDTWVGKRLNGRTEITLADLERIAGVLGVGVIDLLPRRDGGTAGYPGTSPGPLPAALIRPPDRRPPNRPTGRSGGAVRTYRTDRRVAA